MESETSVAKRGRGRGRGTRGTRGTRARGRGRGRGRKATKIVESDEETQQDEPQDDAELEVAEDKPISPTPPDEPTAEPVVEATPDDEKENEEFKPVTRKIRRII